MKRNSIVLMTSLLVGSVVGTPSVAADALQGFCNEAAALAEDVLTARQRTVTKKQIIEKVKNNGMPGTESMLVLNIVEQAYKKEIWPTDSWPTKEDQARQARRFRKEIYKDCMSSGGAYETNP